MSGSLWSKFLGMLLPELGQGFVSQIRSLEPLCVMAVLLFLLQSLQLSRVISGQALG